MIRPVTKDNNLLFAHRAKSTTLFVSHVYPEIESPLVAAGRLRPPKQFDVQDPSNGERVLHSLPI